MNISIRPYGCWALSLLLLSLAGPARGAVTTTITKPAEDEAVRPDVFGQFPAHGTVTTSGLFPPTPDQVRLQIWWKNPTSGEWFPATGTVDLVLEQNPQGGGFKWKTDFGIMVPGIYRIDAQAWRSSDDEFLGEKTANFFSITDPGPVPYP